MNKRIKKKRWIEIKLAECLAREHLIMSAVTGQNERIFDQAKEITELRSIIERNAQAANSEIESLRNEIELLKKPKKKSFFNRK